MIIDQQVNQLADLALAKHAQLVAAESCTGGGIAQAITELAGSSRWFDRGFVTYSNNAKQTMLGVPPATLLQWGAVSEQTALAMAQGALTHSQGTMSVAVTGIAGPGGGSTEKPVGTVWVGWCQRGETATAQLFHFSGDRNSVRQQTIQAALQGCIDRLSKVVD